MQTDVDPPRVVVALFRDREAAENAIRALQEAGFPRDAIGVAMRDRTAQGRLIAETDSKAAEGAATGALSGGVLGGIVGLLVGVGALAIPGIGPVIAGGALASALGVAGGTAVAGAGIGAATGGILGALVGMGIPDVDARHFDRGVREGGTLVTLEPAGRDAEARAILHRFGGDLGSVTVGQDDAVRAAAPVPSYSTTSGAMTGGAFPGAAAGERTAWAGSDRRDPAHRGRRRTDRQPTIGD
jgi:hypothetical protein